MNMHQIVAVALWITGVGIGFCLFMLCRNVTVFRYMGYVNDAVRAAAKDDIRNGRDWKWRYDAFDVKRDYDAMMWRFWTRPRNYYKDRSFMEPSQS